MPQDYAKALGGPNHVYHFTQFGAIQPYLGGGIVPSFELAVQDGFNTGGSFAPTVGLVAQAGSDYMFNRNWGVFLDVKKLFIWSTGKSTGFDLGPPMVRFPGPPPPFSVEKVMSCSIGACPEKTSARAA